MGRRVPLLLESLAWFECQLVGEHPAGDHVLVLGRPDETVVVSHPYDQSRLDDSRLRTDVLVQVEKFCGSYFALSC